MGIILSVLRFIENTVALVDYSEGAGAAAAVAFLWTTNMGKLLQHKLIRVLGNLDANPEGQKILPSHGVEVVKGY